MNNKTRVGFGSALVASVAVALSGCANLQVFSPEPSAAERWADYEVEIACNIQRLGQSREATFSGGDTVALYRDPIAGIANATEDLLATWSGRSIVVSSAAGENPAYLPFRDITSVVAKKQEKANFALKNIFNSNSSQTSSEKQVALYEFFTDEDIDDHNEAVQAWREECLAIADRWNG